MSASTRQQFALARRARTRTIAALSLPLLLTISGCSYSPSFDILGSYFPSWIICCAVAAIATYAAHRAFVRYKVIGELWPLPVVYTGLFSFVSCTLWLIFFN